MVSLKVDDEGYFNVNIRIPVAENDLNIPKGEELIFLRGSEDIFPLLLEKLINVFGTYDPKDRKGYIPGISKGYKVVIEEVYPIQEPESR